MIWKVVMFVTLIMGLVKSLPAQTQPATDSLRLSQVVSEVVGHNDRLAAMRYMEESAKAKAKSAGAWDDPMLMLGVVSLPTNFDFKMDPMTMRMVGLSQNIPYAGQKGLERKSALADAQAAAQDRFDTELELATAAKLAYYDLFYNLRSLDLLMKQIEVSQDVVASVQSRVATSQGNPEDAYAAQADLWRLQTQLMPSAHTVENAKFNLNTLRGLPTETPVHAPATPDSIQLPANADTWIAAAREHYPPLQKLSAQAKSYAFSAEAARRMQWPMFSLSADYGFRYSTEMEQRDNMLGFQATLSLPIFSGRKQRAMGKSMDLMKSSTESEAKQLDRDVATKLKSLYLDALHLRENAGMFRERIIPADEDAYRNAFSGYTNNRTTLASLLNYALTMFRDRLTVNQLDYDLARTLAEVERYTTDPADLSRSQNSNTNQTKDN